MGFIDLLEKIMEEKEPAIKSVETIKEFETVKEVPMVKEIKIVCGEKVLSYQSSNQRENSKENPLHELIPPTQRLTTPKERELKDCVWNVVMEELVTWFHSAKAKALLPTGSFVFESGITVVDTEKFYLSLEDEIQIGPSGPRCKFGALQFDLERLKKIVEQTCL